MVTENLVTFLKTKMFSNLRLKSDFLTWYRFSNESHIRQYKTKFTYVNFSISNKDAQRHHCDLSLLEVFACPSNFICSLLQSRDLPGF